MSKNIFDDTDTFIDDDTFIDIDMKYSDVCFLSAHNAYSSRAYRWLYRQHSLTWDEMFSFGVRRFNLDIHWHKYSSSCNNGNASSSSSTGEHLALMHSSNKFLNMCIMRFGPPMKLEVFIEWLARTIKNNPTEIITLAFESYTTADIDTNPSRDEKSGARALYNLLDSYGIAKYCYYHARNRDEWPTIRHLLENRKRLIIFSGNPNDAGRFSEISARGNSHGRKSSARTADTTTDASALASCGIMYGKRHVSNPHWDYSQNPDGSIIQNNYGQLFGFPHKKSFSSKTLNNYKKLNSYSEIMRRIEGAREGFEKLGRPNMIPNFLNLDFVEIGDAKKVLKRLNRLHKDKARGDDYSSS